MTRFSWHGYGAQVDERATRDCYEKAGAWDCSCGHCRNFLALARARRLPGELLAILDSLSIPPEKATYVCELYHDKDWREKGLLYEASWRIAGRVVQTPDSKENEGTKWGPPVRLPALCLMLGHETFPMGAEFPQPNFDLDVSLHLPWVLDEPLDGPNSPDTKES